MLPTGMDPSSTLKRTWRFLDQQAIPSDLSAFAPNSSPPESGVSLTDCPHNGRKGVADQMILVDMLSYARDHPTPATIFLISGDRDFAYAVSVLQMRNYEVVVLSLAAHISLRNQASAWIDWRTHVLAYCTSGSAETPTAADVGSTPSPPRMASYFGDRECAATPGSAKSSPESPASTNAPSLERLRERPTVVSIPAPAYSAPELPNPTSRGRVEESGRVSPAPSVPSLASPILLASPVRNPGASQSPPGGQKPPTAPKRKVPAIFQPLVDVLEKHHAKGVPRPLRSAVGYELWSKIKEKKGKNDLKKNAMYTKASRDILAAVRLGTSADPEQNTALAAILRRLKDVPKELIQNALERAKSKKEQRGDDVVYEALAFNKVGLIIECTTDNPTRTISNIRAILTDHEYNIPTSFVVFPSKIAAASSRMTPVRFMFNRVGSVKASVSKGLDDHEQAVQTMVETAILNGADDLEESLTTETEVEMKFTCPPEALDALTRAMSTPAGHHLIASEIIFAPVDPDAGAVEDDPEMATKVADLVRDLEDDQDTKRVWSSWFPGG
ncbi:transcriptional regulator-domain-containing protein [Mycena filopes]|nr:transcriptional regulator-domain-containing protein [Mycena filopes]